MSIDVEAGMRFNCDMSDQQTVRLSVRAVLIENDKILLSRYVTDGRTWYVTPGGGVKHNELIAEAIEREVLEETGYAVRSECLVGMREVITDRMKTDNLEPGFHQVELFCKVVRQDKTQLEPTAMDRDQIGYEWVSINKLDQLTVYPKDLRQTIDRTDALARSGQRTTSWLDEAMCAMIHLAI